jgi:phosphopantetheinyl transferase (holo-ACP synthase)
VAVFIGNDIVDLRGESETCHPRFARRVLTDYEYQEYRLSHDPHRYLWTAWAAKEAAYKVVRQSGDRRVFRPAAFEYRRCTGFVQYGGRSITTEVRAAPDYVVAIANLGSGQYTEVTRVIEGVLRNKSDRSILPCSGILPLESVVARHLIATILASELRCSSADIVVLKDQWGVPEAYVKGKRSCVALSISHHERYVSIAIGLPDNYPESKQRRR